MALDPRRRAALEQARAANLLSTEFGVDATLEAFPFGVTARAGKRGWIVSMSDDLSSLGAMLVWVDRNECEEVNVVVDHHSAIHARRAAVIAPEVIVWRTGQSGAVQALAVPPSVPPTCPDSTADLQSILREAGLEIVCEDGVIRGELAGLEVARVVDADDGFAIEVGVGRFDREAGSLLHAGRSPEAALAQVIAQVAPHRQRGAHPHAINRLARERWLRSEIMADPAKLGIENPEPVEPVPPRANLLETTPAALIATVDVRRILVVCSVGVDLGLIPAIADLLVIHHPDEVRVVVPERDRLPHLERLVERIPVTANIVAADLPWARSETG